MAKDLITSKGYSEIKDKIKELKEKKFNYKIHDVLGCNGYIKNMSKTEVLNNLASLIGKFELQSKAASELGINNDYKYSGHTLDEWKADFAVRISELENKKEIEKHEKALSLIGDNLDHSDKKIVVNSELQELLK